MSEEKLTVAELMARRRQEGASSDAPRRRRRRSLEEGGISVKELTGSIPRVKADGPRRGAHAMGSAGEEVDEQAQQTENPLADDTTAQPAEVVEPAVTEQAAEAPDPTPEQVPETVAEEDSPKVEAASKAAATPAAPAAQEAPKAPAAQPVETSALPIVVPMAPRPVMINSERSEITYTFTELRNSENSEQTVGKPGPVARAVLDGSNSYDDRPTASIPVIEDVEQPVKVAPQAAASVDSAEGHGGVAETEDEVAVDKPKVVEWTGGSYGADAKREQRPAAEEPQAEDQTEDQVQEPAEENEPQGAEKKAQKRKSDKRATAKDAKEDPNYSEDNSLSVPLLLIQVFVGLILGAVVFLGFTLAWQQLPTAVVVILALIISGGLAAIANYVRRSRDIATPILAGVVGLALTFGPWLIFQL